MRNDEAGAPLGHTVKGLLNTDLGTGINRGRCLIQNQNGRQTEHDTGDAEQLALTLRQSAAVLPNGSGISLRQTLDKAVSVRCLGRLDDLLVGGVGPTHGDVVTYGAGFEPGLLQNHAEVATQRIVGDLTDVGTVHKDPTALYVIEAHQQIDQCRFAATGRAYDGDLLTRLDMQGKVLKKLALGNVGEGDAFHDDLAAGCGKIGLALVGGNGCLLDQIKETGGTGQRVLQLGDHAGDLIEGLGVLIGVAEEGGKLTDGKGIGGGQRSERGQRTGDAHCRVNKAVDEARGGIGDGGEEDGTQGAMLESPVDLVKLGDGLILMSESTDELLVAYHLIDQRCLLTASGGLQTEHRIGTVGDKARDQQGNGGDDDHHQRDGGADGQHKDQGTEDGDQAGKKLGKAHQQAVGKGVNVRNDAADDVAVRVTVQILQRQLLDLAEGLGAHIADDVVGNLVVDGVHQPLCQGGHGGADAHGDEDGEDLVEVDVPRVNDLVNGVTHQYGNVEGEGDGQRGKCQGENEQQAIATDGAPYLGECPATGGVFLGGFCFHDHASSLGNCE